MAKLDTTDPIIVAAAIKAAGQIVAETSTTMRIGPHGSGYEAAMIAAALLKQLAREVG
ncbi:hypothetical protein [Streptomyces sp. DHE17-7]|uniref:hypothetical protein n=1 Tax=Streptomyces sp. DHE17-7 TaxID=2759949 RepID=UPI0022EA195F|nr:hypothetical protein [Streptomyces sp. DHE17-7]MBJ6623614.1 hypothetical protein [Streptomyces sp. DHE17-7]